MDQVRDLASDQIQEMQLATRGVVLTPRDLSLSDWPQRAKNLGLTTIALHATKDLWRIKAFLDSDEGALFLSKCKELNLHVEYEHHAMHQLLPRDLFRLDPAIFRMNDNGNRVADFNLCVHSKNGLDIVAENALIASRAFVPTTNRHFYWGDDGKPWCRCPKCKEYSDSEQALILENRIIDALREDNPHAQLAHLAYLTTLEPPRQVKPNEGIFLEFAPIRRRYDIPYSDQTGDNWKDPLDLLEANLEVFDLATAQVLEYWLDVSLFVRQQRKAPGQYVPIPWSSEVFRDDINTYVSRGIRHITTFAVMFDAKYVSVYGDEPLREYGAGLKELGVQ